MGMNDADAARIYRSVREVRSPKEVRADRDYWRTRSPQERLEALELLRQITYGYDPAATRLQRIFEIVELE